MPTVTVNTTETTFVSSAQPNSNFSLYPLMHIGTDVLYQTCISFLKFDLPALPVIAVDSAFLQLSVIVKTGAAPSPMVVNYVTSPLKMTSVTYSTQPLFVSTSSQINVTTADFYTFVQFDVTQIVNEWISGNLTNNGFALTNSDGTTVVQFGTNNILFEPYFPKLILTYSGTPPEESAIESGTDTSICSTDNSEDLNVETAMEELFFSQSQPIPILLRSIPAPTGNTLFVGSTQTYTSIQSAIDAAGDGDVLLLDAETFAITTLIVVDKSVIIQGKGIGTTIVTTADNTITDMFAITVSNVVIRDMSIIQNFPSIISSERVIYTFSSAATDLYVDNCEISACKVGIHVLTNQFQITNCIFNYAPLASLDNDYSYISISSTSGTSIISNNHFQSASGDSRCNFINISELTLFSGTLQGELLIHNNIQSASPFTLRHLLMIEEFLGSDFELFIENNTILMEGDAPVLFLNADNDIFRFIEVVGNNVQNTAGKGLIGIDGSSAGSTEVINSNNVITNQSFTTDWAPATFPSSFISGYNTQTIPIAPDLPLANCYWLPVI